MRSTIKRYSTPGSSPGIRFADDAGPGTPADLTIVTYDARRMEEKRLTSATIHELPLTPEASVWIDVAGSQDRVALRWLGEQFGLHPLALEDVVNHGQRPKLNLYDDHVFVVLRSVSLKESAHSVQVNLFFGRRFVISIHDDSPQLFEPVRDRLRNSGLQIRGQSTDYLAYALMDAVVDQFFPLLEEYGERLERLEEQLVEAPDRHTLHRIHEIKRDFLHLRRAAWPNRDVVSQVERIETPLIHKNTRIYLRDCYEHAVQIMDTIENCRDLVTGMLDVYLSSMSHRTNEVMKVLTVMASIFIPVTFLAGVYGMNFDTSAGPWNMPELRWGWGYPFFWALVVGVTVGMLAVFRRKGWV